MPIVECPSCGNDQLIQGGLHSPMRTSFRPQNAKFLTFDTGDVMLKAVMCSECGAISLIGDTRKLKRLVSGTPSVPE